MIANKRFSGYFASAEEWEIDSKPTYAHGAKANSVNVPPAALCCGENAGWSTSVPLLLTAAATKQTVTPHSSRNAKTVCIAEAAFLRRQTSAPIRSAAITSNISPKYI